MTWWMVSLSATNGAAVRAQLGKNYYILSWGNFECPWHRRKMTSDSVRRFREETGQHPSVPCEAPKDWWPDFIRSEALDGLPVWQLPDWRQVTFVPALERFGSVLPHEWKQIKDGAKVSRGPLIEHAYEVSLEMLQRWQEIGVSTLRKLDAREQRIRERRTEPDPAEEIAHEDIGIPDWIYQCARGLYYRHKGNDGERDHFEKRMTTFKPHEMAFAAVAAATGYAPSSVETILRRSRGSKSRRKPKSHAPT